MLVVAKQVLDQQKDANGEPRRVDLPVRINYAVSRKAMVDQDMEIDFEFITEQPIPVLRFGVETSEGLELVSSNIRERYESLKIRQVINRRVIVAPTSEDKFYLNLYVVTETGEDKRARLVRVPIAVGDYSLSDNPPSRPQ